MAKTRELTAEHVMLVALLLISLVFFIEPVIQDYPTNAAIFPRMMAAVVIVGSALLLVRNYLPGPLKTFVAESVSITTDDDDGVKIQDESTEEQDDVAPEDRTLGAKYGFVINNTVFVSVTAAIYLIVGYAVGLLYVTPIYVFLYTLWFRVEWYIGLLLAGLATIILMGFIRYLLLPFDSGVLIDFSQLLFILPGGVF
ncbi:MAG: hypothetical protein ACQETB_04390 [Halobacteriota archaeon]